MTMQICYLNHELIPLPKAHISCQDRGLLLGDGLFETLRCYQGTPFALNEHWQRLNAGAQLLKIPLPFNEQEWDLIIRQLLKANNLQNQECGSRLTITRGCGERGLAPPTNPLATVLITVFPLPQLIKPFLKLSLSNYVRNEFSPLCGFKSLNYLEHITALHQALQLGFDDAILQNTKGFLCCSSNANLFLIKNNEIFTPSLNDGALPGITRQYIIKLAGHLGIKIYELSLTPTDLENADEVFLTNSLREIQLVSQYENTIYQIDKENLAYNLQNSFRRMALYTL